VCKWAPAAAVAFDTGALAGPAAAAVCALTLAGIVVAFLAAWCKPTALRTRPTIVCIALGSSGLATVTKGAAAAGLSAAAAVAGTIGPSMKAAALMALAFLAAGAAARRASADASLWMPLRS
jgi:hypothetical protein